MASSMIEGCTKNSTHFHFAQTLIEKAKREYYPDYSFEFSDFQPYGKTFGTPEDEYYAEVWVGYNSRLYILLEQIGCYSYVRPLIHFSSKERNNKYVCKYWEDIDDIIHAILYLRRGVILGLTDPEKLYEGDGEGFLQALQKNDVGEDSLANMPEMVQYKFKLMPDEPELGEKLEDNPFVRFYLNKKLLKIYEWKEQEEEQKKIAQKLLKFAKEIEPEAKSGYSNKVLFLNGVCDEAGTFNKIYNLKKELEQQSLYCVDIMISVTDKK